MKLKVFLYRIISICIGLVLGLFFGLIIFGTIIRIILDLLFHWGDSGPEWANWLIAVITCIFVFSGSYISVQWMNSFLDKKPMGN
jgi:hypothetical protein